MPRFSPAPIQQYRGTHRALRTYVGPEGELVMDTTQGRVVVMDGETAGGIPLARLDEITGTTFVRTDGAVELDGTAGRSIRYYITVDGSATIPEGVSAPYWVWNYIVDDEETNFTLQFLRATDGSIYNREGSEPEGSGSDWSEWAQCGSGGGSADEFVTLDTEQTITAKKTFYATEIALESDVEMQDNIIRFTRTDTGREIRVGVGEGGQNRGIYDADNNCWMINYNSRDELVLDGGATVGSASEPIYLNKGVPTACNIDTSNYVTLDTAQTISGTKVFAAEPWVEREVGNNCMYFSQVENTSLGTTRISFGIGTGGTNRGIYDNTQTKWMICYNEAGNLCLDGTGPLTGLIVMCAKSSIPAGWLQCNGANVSRETYANLFSAIGTTYGSGDGSTTFTLPDFRNRFPEGVNTYSLGTSVSAGVPQISGYFATRAYGSGTIITEYSGCHYNYGSGSGTDNITGNGTYYAPTQIGFQASRSSSVYSTSYSTVQPEAVAVYFIIKT